jgi:hypothetical protein
MDDRKEEIDACDETKVIQDKAREEKKSRRDKVSSSLLGSSGRVLCRVTMWVREGEQKESNEGYVLVTDLVPSEMACLESSPGRIRRTAV